MNKEQIFKELTNKMNEIHKIKNHDYGNSVHQTYLDFGLTSFLVRMQDKMNRLKSLSKKDALVKDESIEDTLLDLANYSILALIELKEERNDKNV